MLKIDNFKLGQIEKIVSFFKRGSLTENNGTIINVYLLMVREEFNFFKNFTLLSMRSTKNLIRFKNSFEIRDLHHFANKNVPHTIPQIPTVTEIQQFRSNQLMLKIDNFKLGQIEKIVSFFKRGSLTENNGTIINVYLLMVREEFNFFKNFTFLSMRSTKNLIRFKNSFEIRDLHHFANKNVPHTIPQIPTVTEIQQFRSNQLMLKIDNFKLGQIEKIVSFFKRGSLTENNGTIINVYLLMVREEFNFFKNFTLLSMRSTKNLIRFKNSFEIRDLHHFANKNVPHTIPQIPTVTEIQQFRSNQLMLKIDNFKLGQIEKIVSFFKRGSLTENNGTIINVYLLMVREEFNFFKNFKKLLMGGHDEKLKNFGKSRKKSLIFTN